MYNSYLILFESLALVVSTGLLFMLSGLRHAPLGFQHYNLFYFGETPAGLVPVESSESAPPGPANWS